MKKGILIIFVSIMNILYSFARLIMSFDLITYENNGGYSIKLNSDYLVWFITFIFVLIIGIKIKKEEK